MKPVRWYHSVAVKSCLVAFVATHIPLLGLIAVIVVWPGLLTPWGTFLIALLLTLVATAFVVSVLWRMFRPLREAADGLLGFMSSGSAFRPAAGNADEVGRLVQVLVSALAHLDRSRGALLYSSSITVGNAADEMSQAPGATRQWLALLEADQWEALDGDADLGTFIRLHEAMERAVDALLQAGELSLPWGRGRFLILLNGSGADAVERLDSLCRQIDVDGMPGLTASAAVEPQTRDPQARAAALQRLEHKLFSMRTRGARAAVA